MQSLVSAPPEFIRDTERGSPGEVYLQHYYPLCGLTVEHPTSFSKSCTGDICTRSTSLALNTRVSRSPRYPLSPPLLCAHHHHKTWVGKQCVVAFALTVRPLEGILWLVEPCLRHFALPSPDRASGSVASLIEGPKEQLQQSVAVAGGGTGMGAIFRVH